MMPPVTRITAIIERHPNPEMGFWYKQSLPMSEVAQRHLEDYLGVKLPDRYKVTYTLAPTHGELRLGPLNIVELAEDHNKIVTFICFLPVWWVGRRMNRKMEVL